MSSAQVSAPEGHGGLIIDCVNWILCGIMCVVTLTKVGTKIVQTREFQRDDFYIVAAMLTAVGHAVARTAQVTGGLGRHMSTLSEAQIELFEKSEFASEILYILSLSLAMHSLFHIYTGFARNDTRRTIVFVAMTFNILWAMGAILAISFQCHVPHTWTVLSKDCFNMAAFWEAIAATNIIIDLSIVIVPIFLLHDINMPLKRKMLIMSAFAGRLLDIVLIIAHAVYVSSALKSPDPTFELFNPVLCTVIDVNVSVIVSSIPFIKPFVESLQVGLFSSDPRILAPRQPGPIEKQTTGYRLGWFALLEQKWKATSNFHSRAQLWTRNDGGGTTTITAGKTGGKTVGKRLRPDLESRASSGDSDRMIIRQTFGMSVQSEPTSRDSSRD